MSKKVAYMHPEDVPIPHTMRDLYPGDAFFGDPKADELRKSQRKDEGGYETTPDKAGPNWEKPEGAEEAPARERYELEAEPKRARRNYDLLLKSAADPEAPAQAPDVPAASAPASPGRPLPEALAEWKKISAEMEGLKQALAKLDKTQKGLFDEIGPQMNALEEKTAVIDNLVYKYSEYTSTSVSYSSLWEAALKKVNAATAKVLGELQKELTKPTAPVRKMKVTEQTPPKTSRLVFAGWLDTIKGWFGKLLGTMDTAISELTAVGEDMEQGATTAKKQASRRPVDTLGDDPEWLDDLLPEHLQKRAAESKFDFTPTVKFLTFLNSLPAAFWERVSEADTPDAKMRNVGKKLGDLIQAIEPKVISALLNESESMNSHDLTEGIMNYIGGWPDPEFHFLSPEAAQEREPEGLEPHQIALDAPSAAEWEKVVDLLGQVSYEAQSGLGSLPRGLGASKHAALSSGATSPASTIGSPPSTGTTGDMGGGFKPGDAVSDPTGRAGTVKEMTPDGKMNVEFRDATGGPQSAVYDPKSPTIKRAATPPPWVLQVMAAYIGDDPAEPFHAEELDWAPDPRMSDVWAARYKGFGDLEGLGGTRTGYTFPGFLITGKDPDSQVEEVEFKTWPPQARKNAATPGPSGREMDPAAKPLARAPAGMETDEQTGTLKMSPTDNELPSLRVPGKLAVVFPNLERKHYSVRPYFVHNWLNDVKLACKRGGYKLEGDTNADYLTIHVASRAEARQVILKLVKQFNLRPEQLRLASHAKTASVKTAKQYRQASDAEEIWLEKFADEMGNQTDTPMSSSPADAQTEPLPEELAPTVDEEPELDPGTQVEVQSADGESFTGTVTTKVEEGYLIEKDGQPGSEVEAPVEQVTAIRKITASLADLVAADEPVVNMRVKHATTGFIATVIRTSGGAPGKVLLAMPNRTHCWMPAADFLYEGHLKASRVISDEDWLDERALRGPHNPGMGLKY